MSTPNTQTWVLLAEDDADLSATLSDTLSARGYRVIAVTKATDAIAKLRNQHFSCIILDLRLEKGSSGEEIIESIRADKKHLNAVTPILVTSGFLDADFIRRSGKHVAGVLVKPFSTDSLIQKIEGVIQKP